MVWGFFAASGPGRLTAKGSVPKFQQRARLISSYKYILAFSWSWLMWKFQGFYDCLSSHILLTYITRLFAIFQRSKWTVQMILVPRTTLWTLTRDLSRYWGSAVLTEGNFGVTVESMHACCHLCAVHVHAHMHWHQSKCHSHASLFPISVHRTTRKSLLDSPCVPCISFPFY